MNLAHNDYVGLKRVVNAFMEHVEIEHIKPIHYNTVYNIIFIAEMAVNILTSQDIHEYTCF